MKTWKIIAIVVAVVLFLIVGVSVIGYAFLAGFISTSSTSNSTTTQTWSQYGMSLQYPSGLQAQYEGVFEQQATANSGTVYWIWNQANTELALTWVNTTHFDYSAGFQAIYNGLQNKDTNVMALAQGNVTMAGETWQYETFSYVNNGKTGYETCALLFLPNNSRAFELDFIDTNSNTLNSMETYGITFTS